MTQVTPEQHVYQLAEEQGFALCGITSARLSDHTAFYDEWIKAQHHGEMHYLQAHQAMRQDPRRLLEHARSVICCADVYAAPGDEQSDMPQDHGRFARYAHGRDYHKVLKKRLHRMADALRDRFPDEVFRCTTDTAPILEREHAARAGLGWIGRHTLLLNRDLGSWLLLGCIVTTLELDESVQGDRAAGHGPLQLPEDGCANCTRCVNACPTDAIHMDNGRWVEATRCISYLTLEHRSPIDETLQQPMGDWIGGCDICQDVCPYNARPKKEPVTPNDAYASNQGQVGNGVPLLDLLRMDAPQRERLFRGSALKRMKLPMLLRNACIAAGNHLLNHHDSAMLRAVEELLHDEDATVRQTAEQTLRRLHGET